MLLILIYFSFYFALGGSLPFLSQYFTSGGISGKEIGIIFSIGSLTTVIFQPLFGYLNDKLKKTKSILFFIMVIALVSIKMFYSVDSFAIALIAFILYSIAIYSKMPLLDVITLATDHNFGKIRLWGSIGFSVGSLVGGQLIERFGTKSFLLASGTLFIIAQLLISTLKIKIPEKKKEKVRISGLFKNKKYILFVIMSALFTGTVFGHNSFFGVYFKEIGGSTKTFGIAVFLLTLSEVPFMGITDKLIKRFGSEGVLILATIFNTIRWGIYFMLPIPNIILITFMLQGASTGIYFGASGKYTKELVGENLLSTGITIYMAAGTLGGMIIQFCSGFILDSFRARSLYLLFSILSFTALFFLNFKSLKIRDEQIKTVEG